VTTADEILRDCWLELRNDASPVRVACVLGHVIACRKLGFITDNEAELWQYRVQTCPGHDDEEGRQWCAYCGTLAALAAVARETAQEVVE
jgi:hypothetical protein